MDILWASSKTNHRGGGSTSERTLLRYLDRTFHNVTRIAADQLNGLGLARGPFEIRQLAIGSLFKKHIRNHIIHGEKPDVIVSQGIYFPVVGEVAQEFNIPHITFIRDQFYRCPVARHNQCSLNCFDCVSTSQKLIWPLVKHLVSCKRKGIDEASLILANSKFMKGDLEQRTDTPVKVLYPPIEHNQDPDDGSHDKIVYMGGGFWKGSKLIMQLAMRLPEFQFIVAGDPFIPKKWDLSTFPNVKWRSWIDREFAVQSAYIHLCPSYWPEPFGRIPVEMGCQGVPSISSDRGGLPESVGDGGILLDPDDVDAWERTIRSVMESPEIWMDLSMKARDHSSWFDISVIGPQFETYLERYS